MTRSVVFWALMAATAAYMAGWRTWWLLAPIVVGAAAYLVADHLAEPPGLDDRDDRWARQHPAGGGRHG